MKVAENRVVPVPPECETSVQSPAARLRTKNACTLSRASVVCHSMPQVVDPSPANLPAAVRRDAGQTGKFAGKPAGIATGAPNLPLGAEGTQEIEAIGA